MTTTARVLLTAAGCNVNTATIAINDGISGKYENNPKNQIPSAYSVINPRIVTTGVDPALDRKMYGQINGIPNMIAYDATSLYIAYAVAAGDVAFQKVLLAATNYGNGTVRIPIIPPF